MFEKFSTLIRKEYLIKLKILAAKMGKKLYEVIDDAIKNYLER